MQLGWNDDKNEELKIRHPGLSFELISTEIHAGRFAVVQKKNNSQQLVFIVNLPFAEKANYPIIVPFVVDPDKDEDGGDRIFLKTFYPSRRYQE